MKNQKCKGARDLLPNDIERFRYIENSFRGFCLKWGYREVRTPTLEYLHLFTAAGTLTPSMLNRVYSFLDWDGWSGERVVLRPDGTIPVARLYIENLPKQEIARLFYVTNVFAFEETGKENRERWQCGVELLGNAKPASDVETIFLAIEIMNSLQIGEVRIQLSHAGMLKALLKELKLTPDKEAKLLSQIRDGNWKALTKTKAGNSDVNRLLSLLLELRGKSSGFLENLKALPEISFELKTELENFAEITSLLDALDCRYQIDITSTRGFEYYTGLCFQFLVEEHKIGGGGRYDDLIPLIGGESTPACGFALYLDPLMNLIKPKAEPELKNEVLVRGTTTTTETTKSCFILAKSLRDAGYVTSFDFNSYQQYKRWLVTVQPEPLLFTIIDRYQGQTIEAPSIAEVINTIRSST